jgi:hypothetical protein
MSNGDPPKSKYQSSISVQLKAYFGGSEEERDFTYGVTGSDVTGRALTGNDVT